MKILFIIPPYSPFEDYSPDNSTAKIPTLAYPYGVLSIASYINQNQKHNIQIFDSNVIIVNAIKEKMFNFKELILKELERELLRFKPDIVGVSTLCATSYSHLEYIIPFIHENGNPYLIVGGSFATNAYKLLFEKFPQIDAICYGEGEEPFKKLLNVIHKYMDVHLESTAWITKKSLEMGVVPEHDFVQNLDDIPIVDYSYIKNHYMYNDRSLIDKDKNSGRVELYIHTSRGCPFNCIFCANSKTHGKKIRFMSVNIVKETIFHYVEDYDMNVLIIEDDHFLSKKDRAIEILKLIKSYNIKVEFPNGIAVRCIDEEVAYWLKEAGTEVVPLAIESGSDYVLKEIIDKPLTVDQIYTAVNILKNVDIRVHAFIVIGFPDETDEHRKETLKMLIKAKVDWAYIFIAIPTMGSRLYDQCKEKGYLLNDDFSKYTTIKCNIKSPNIDPKKIEEYAYYMNIVVNFFYNSNFRDEKYDIAKKYFTNVLKHYPNHAPALSLMGSILEQESKNFYIKANDMWDNNEFWRNLLEKYKDDREI